MWGLGQTLEEFGKVWKSLGSGKFHDEFHDVLGSFTTGFVGPELTKSLPTEGLTFIPFWVTMDPEFI